MGVVRETGAWIAGMVGGGSLAGMLVGVEFVYHTDSLAGCVTVIAASHMYFDVVALRLLTHWIKLYRSNGSTSDGVEFDSDAATLDVRHTRSVS